MGLPVIDVDRARIRQVILNLVNNAVRFTQQGFIEVGAEAGADEVTIFVRDTGRGIPADKLETIFGEFEQADMSLRRPHRGAGLGLAICRHFVQLHGGRIWAESQVGQGSTFYFVLPIKPSAQHVPALHRHRPLAQPESAPRSMVVLCSRARVSRFLQRRIEGLELQTAKTVAEAAHLVDDLHPAAALVVADGTDLAGARNQARALLEEIAPFDLPTIVCTLPTEGLASEVTEAGGAQDTIRDDGEIYEELLGQLWSEWDHIKNGPHREQASCWDLLWVSPKAGKRESRRFLGDVVLTQTDLEAGRRFEDDIAYGGHDLDDHRPLRAGGNIVAHSVPPLYGIPYRACYSRNVPNLLLAGRLISATHLAHSSTRLMRTGGAIGQAMGIAASLCVRHGCAPRAVYERHLEALQRALLEADGTILARPKSAEGDLARQATASASSELRFNDQEPGEMVPLIAPVGILLWDWAPTLDGLELYLSSQSAQPEPLTVRLLRAKRDRTWKSMEEYEAFGRNDLRDQAFAQLASFEATVPPKHDGWFRIALPEAVTIGAKDSTSDDDRLLICIDGGAALSWALARDRMPIAEAVEHSHMQPEWHQIGAMFTMRLSPAPKLGEASNAINGFYRRFSTGPTNMWMSNPAGGLPQELVLTWETPQTIDEVHLVLDNLCRLRHENPWENATRVAPHLIKAYELLWRQAWRGDGDAWKRLVQEELNHHRFRQHSSAVTTDRLCLRVLAVHGGLEGTRVYSVRVPAKTSR